MIYENLPFADYRKLEGLNASKLKWYYDSPRDGKYREHKPLEPTSAMNHGTLIHAYILEGEEVARELLNTSFITDLPINPSSGKPYGEKSIKFLEWKEEQPQDKMILYPDQLDETMDILKSVSLNDAASAILKECPRREVAMTWDIEGTLCKGLLDALGPVRITDLKTTAQIPTRKQMENTNSKFKYVLQFAFYYDGAQANKFDVSEFTVLYVQTKAPYHIGWMTIDYDTLMYGMDQYMIALQNYKTVEHIDAKDYLLCPGRQTDNYRGGLPSWEMKEAEFNMNHFEEEVCHIR